jgi:serine protease Do
MRASYWISFAFAIVLAIAPARAQEMQYDRSTLVQSLLPMVVNITALVAVNDSPPQMAGAMPDPGLSSPVQQHLLGSGFVIDPAGEIITNYHVITGAYEIVATFSDGMQLEAQIEAADRLSDIALLKVKPPHPLKSVTWGNSRLVRVGDPVLAIGNPLGVGLSVTGGIVSAVNRNIMETPYDDYIQTDAPINHGNSGGPLFNMQGEVIGINTAIISPTAASAGLGFAMPAADVQFVVSQLRQFGWLHPGWLGIKVQQITNDMADALGLNSPRGSIVAMVFPSSPAQKAGIRVGDIVLDYDHRAPSDERALLRDIGMTVPGTETTLTIRRDGHITEVKVKVGEWPRQQWERFDAPITPVKVTGMISPDLGVTVADLAKAQRVRFGLSPETPAVIVTAVARGTDAAQRGLAAGDAILRVQDRDISTPDDYKKALQTARAENRRFVLFLILPQKQVHPGPEWRAFQIRP